MSQYKIGTVTVTNGSATITGTGTEWLTNVAIGDEIIVNDPSLLPTQLVYYTVGGVVSDTELTLTAPYGGPSGGPFSYVAHRDFIAGRIAKLANGDVETAGLYNLLAQIVANLSGTEAALGTAALLDAQTSPTDATADRVMKVGAFGLGAVDSIELDGSDNIDDIVTTGLYNWGSPAPVNAPEVFCTMFVNADSSFQTQDIIRRDNPPRKYTRVRTGAGWYRVEGYTTGNLNQFEFGSSAANDRVAIGAARSATEADFYLPVGLYSPPSGITVAGAFSVRRYPDTVIAAGQVPVFSATSSSKLAVTRVSGLAGLTTGEALFITTDSGASKITVNP